MTATTTTPPPPTAPNVPLRDWTARVLSGEVPPPPVARTLGIRLIRAGDGEAVAELKADPDVHANPMGTLHGGILADLGDLAMGVAIGSTLERGESFTTLELKINFFKPVWNSNLTATARIIKRTRATCYLECDIHDEKSSLVARLGSTCMVLHGDMAAGR
jgi:uncharacterized protein (TIGR00369 family)